MQSYFFKRIGVDTKILVFRLTILNEKRHSIFNVDDRLLLSCPTSFLKTLRLNRFHEQWSCTGQPLLRHNLPLYLICVCRVYVAQQRSTRWRTSPVTQKHRFFSLISDFAK